jgi:ubiquinone/menaquinone biosynthesis C-methylase UbiE
VSPEPDALPSAPVDRTTAPESFDRSAAVYDDHVAFNRSGAMRLVRSIPDGTYPRLLDVACGTGFATLAAIPRLGVREVIGVDASGPMIEVFRERVAAYPEVAADLRVSDVLHMGVPDGWADLALCTMALHWFADRAAAIGAITQALAPGGLLGILAPGPRHDRETVDRIRATGDPLMGRLADAILDNEVAPDVICGLMADAGLEIVDAWTETRRRAVAPSSYAARLEAVATHLWSDLPPSGQQGALTRVRGFLDGHTGADGLYRYGFVKTFVIGRLPA